MVQDIKLPDISEKAHVRPPYYYIVFVLLSCPVLFKVAPFIIKTLKKGNISNISSKQNIVIIPKCTRTLVTLLETLSE